MVACWQIGGLMIHPNYAVNKQNDFSVLNEGSIISCHTLEELTVALHLAKK